MKQRSIVWVIVWGILTGGIYSMVWTFKTTKELRRSGAPRTPSPWVWVAPAVAAMALMLVGLVMNGVQSEADGTFWPFFGPAIILVLASVVAYIWWSYQYAKSAEKVLKGTKTYRYIFWMGMLFYLLNVSYVWPALVQEEYNKLLEAK